MSNGALGRHPFCFRGSSPNQYCSVLGFLGPPMLWNMSSLETHFRPHFLLVLFESSLLFISFPKWIRAVFVMKMFFKFWSTSLVRMICDLCVFQAWIIAYLLHRCMQSQTGQSCTMFLGRRSLCWSLVGMIRWLESTLEQTFFMYWLITLQ